MSLSAEFRNALRAHKQETNRLKRELAGMLPNERRMTKIEVAHLGRMFAAMNDFDRWAMKVLTCRKAQTPED